VRILTWLVRAAAFLLLLAFAVKNTEPITLRFYFDLAWQAPLVLLLLAFFAAGALVGLAATLTTILRQRRELQQLKREPRGPAAGPPLPPVADG
jgi:putative membrane protein